ncbi:hypothetical protein TBR22_A32730 [Luteitalea sp. TBR-22]|uniref:DUF6515 family protein n=1 Tax=Luteitalea sp. TBR-22 TaxID=2802971 RepID=UPI001AF804AE|nr:DUF6515 family protein [Luteitalea sp. TBR-22]BCS34044.1 hypothetical protein TBR22_A32730 [Luteitalea sp. TBR-22]
MTRAITALTVAVALLVVQTDVLLAQRPRGSVHATSRGSVSRSGGTASWESRGGRAQGSRTATRTEDGYNVDKTITSDTGASKTVSREIDTDDRSVERNSTATNRWGQSVSREREVENQGGYAEIEGSARTSTGREASADLVAGRTWYGRPAVGGSVNTKYHGNYNVAAARNPYGGYTKAVAGPYGGKVTTTLPSGYRTTTYYGRPYYSYGGAYYRPYTYHGAHYYYPVPVPYYAYYSTPPVGAIIVMVAGLSYLMAKDGTCAKQTTSSEGKVVYQSVPPPTGAIIRTLPAERVLVTVSGTTYYLAANAFYRRVVSGGQESFVIVTPPAGVVFVAALPADFEVAQLNTMYFVAQGQYYVPYLSADGKELYVMVDRPPQPPAQGVAPAAAPAVAGTSGSSADAAPPVRTVAETFTVASGTLLVVRLATDVSSDTAAVGNRFQGFLDQDLFSGGRLVAPAGAKVYGIVSAAESANKMKGTASLAVTLTDMQVGGSIVSIKTEALSVKGGSGTGTRKLVGGALIGTAIGAIADGGEGAAWGAAIGAGVGGAAAAAGSVKAAVIPAQTPQAFTLAVPFQVEILTNVAVR